MLHSLDVAQTAEFKDQGRFGHMLCFVNCILVHRPTVGRHMPVVMETYIERSELILPTLRC